MASRGGEEGEMSPCRASFQIEKLERQEHERPLRELLLRLPRLTTDSSGRLDLLASPPDLLAEISDYAETTVQVLNLGLAAVGSILPFAAPEIEDGTVPMGTVEALGWLIAELSSVSASVLVLAAECRHARSMLTRPNQSPTEQPLQQG